MENSIATDHLESKVADQPEVKATDHLEVKTMENSIIVDHLEVKAHKVQILNDVSFKVPIGTLCAFVGHNGAGKTTTIKSILNLRRVRVGQITIHDIDSTNLRARDSVGYIPEKSVSLSETGYQFLQEMSAYYKVPKDKFDAFINMVTTSLGLPEDRLHHPLKKLSSGQAKIITIAQAFLHDPQLIIADEPTDNLDPDARDLFWNFITKIRKESPHTTFFISTHQLDEIENYADYVITIRSGSVTHAKPFNKTEKSLRSLYRSL